MEQHLTVWSRNNTGVFIPNGCRWESEKMELEIKDVIHTYPNKKTALNRISLTLTPGIYDCLARTEPENPR